MAQTLSIMLFKDNQSTMKLTASYKNHPRTKYIDGWCHNIKYHTAGTIQLQYFPTEQKISDTLTMPLPKSQFEKPRQNLFC